MPSGKHHVIAAFIANIVVLLCLEFYAPWDYLKMNNLDGIAFWGLIPVIWIYSQFPDVDADASTINKYFNTGMVIVIIYALFHKLFLVGVLAAAAIGILEWVKHRGFTHSWLLAGVMSVALLALHPIWMVAGFVSFATHLLLDKFPRVMVDTNEH